jgi:hypothetical protein
MADAKSLQKSSNRYALSLLVAAVREGRGASFPILCVELDSILDSITLPTLMRTLPILSATDKGWPAKVVATAFNPHKGELPEFRLVVRAHPFFGQWFETGPRKESWEGILFGVTAEGRITHHAVGPQGQIPERTVLEYQIQDMQIQIGDTPFIAWSVQNRLGPEDSYYTRVEGFPTKIIVGGHPGIDQAEVFVIELQ